MWFAYIGSPKRYDARIIMIYAKKKKATELNKKYPRGIWVLLMNN